MKQRITYLVPQGAAIDPDTIEVHDAGVNFTSADRPAIEKRVTVGLSELPDELRETFSTLHELHIRWSSRLNYKAPSPFVSRLPPGLHVFFTPRQEYNVDICPLLKQLFSEDLKCDSSLDAFSRPPILSERFSSSSTYQYFHSLPRLLQFQTSLARTFCGVGDIRGQCVSEAAALSYASYVDLDFDAISHAITLTAFWRAGIEAGAVRTTPRKWRDEDSLEVGVLQPHEPEEPEELKLGGYLAVVGEDGKPSGTLFSFPSRHHPLPPSSAKLAYSINFQQPTGLHPNLDITLPRQHLTPPKDSCALHAYLTLPSALFIDRYQLDDPSFLASHNLISLRSLSGEQDLEAPHWTTKRWGSAALVELAHPPALDPADSTLAERLGNWTATLPMHLRYLQASPNTTTPGFVDLSVPWPSIFWACEAEEGLKMSVNPFDRVNVGFDGLFGPKTMFYHVLPALPEGEVLESKIAVPVLDPKWGQWVQLGTVAAVVVGFGLVMWALGGVAWRDWKGGQEKAEAKVEKKRQ